jgi:hypothetical protein
MDLAASRMLVPALMTVRCVVSRGPDPDVVDVVPVRHRLGDVSLGDDADGLLGLLVVHDHQSRRARVLHQVRGRDHVVARFYRRRRWPHDVRGRGRSMWRPVHGRLLGEGFGHDPLRFRGISTRSPRSVSGLIAGAAGSRLPDDL